MTLAGSRTPFEHLDHGPTHQFLADGEVAAKTVRQRDQTVAMPVEEGPERIVIPTVERGQQHVVRIVRPYRSRGLVPGGPGRRGITHIRVYNRFSWHWLGRIQLPLSIGILRCGRFAPCAELCAFAQTQKQEPRPEAAEEEGGNRTALSPENGSRSITPALKPQVSRLKPCWGRG